MNELYFCRVIFFEAAILNSYVDETQFRRWVLKEHTRK